MFYALLIIFILFFLFGKKVFRLLGILLAGLIGAVGAIILLIINIFFPNGIITMLRKSANIDLDAFSQHNASKNPEVTKAYIQLVACIAKLDGVISQQEASWVSEELNKCAINNLHRNELKAIFNEAKNTPNMYPNSARIIASMHLSSWQLKNMLDSLLSLAIMDGLNSDKVSAIYEISKIWRMQQYITVAFANMGINIGGNGSYSRDSRINKEQALERLGLKSGASFDEVKRAYRKLARQYHPDTLGASNLSKEQMEQMAQKFREINEAYEALKQSMQ